MRRFFKKKIGGSAPRNGGHRPDLLGLVGFHTEAFVIAKPTEPYSHWLFERSQTLHDRLDGATNMTAGLRKAVELVGRAPRGVMKRIWLLSDGFPNRDTDQLAAAVKEARRAYCNVNTIAFGDRAHERLLQQIAAATHNGKFVPVKTLRQLTDALIATDQHSGHRRQRHHHRPETTVLCIDLSWSMSEPMGSRSKVQVVEEAVKRLLFISRSCSPNIERQCYWQGDIGLPAFFSKTED